MSGEPAATDADADRRAGPEQGTESEVMADGDVAAGAETATGAGAAGEAPLEEPSAASGAGPTTELSVEDLLTLVETLTSERDASVEARARLQAEFENYRKRVAKQEAEQTARAADALVTKLLPTLDAFEGALSHEVAGVAPIWASLWSMLEREGMEKLAPVGEAFDPTRHEAVAHEPGEGGSPQVVDVFRSGWVWKGRVLRPAMVKVRD